MNKSLIYILGSVVVIIIITVVLYLNTGIIVSTNDGSMITVDSQQVTNHQKYKLKPGNHRVLITLADYITYDKTIKVSFGFSKTVDIDLRKLPVPVSMVSDTVQFSSLDTNQQTLYYLGNQGKTFYKIDNIYADKLQIEAISPDYFSAVTNVIWSADHQLAIIKQQDKTSLFDFARYDLLHQEIIPFSDGIGNIVWTHDSAGLVYYYAPSDGQLTLVKASSTNTDPQIIYNFKDTTIRNPQISISPDDKYLTLVAQNKLFIFDFYTKNISQVAADKNINGAKFTSDGKILVLASDSAYLSDLNGDLTKLNFNIADINKLNFFSSNVLIIAEKQNNLDAFFTYDLSNGVKTQFAYNTKTKINPINIILGTDNQYLYFESQNTLEKLKIEPNNY